jgi:uncharacterized protein YdeI (YjbR/CyaY-like superfamily)
VVEYERIHPETRAEWRAWLQDHHDHSAGVWVVQWRTVTGRNRLGYSDLVEEALCFGWIDSRARRLDDERSMITMTPRRRGSVWSRSNKERLERLAAVGLMTPAGQQVVDAAKADGSWAALDDVDALVVPEDLAAALATNPLAARHFEAFSPSAKRMILYWIGSARRPPTRLRRVTETVRLAAENRRPGSPAG